MSSTGLDPELNVHVKFFKLLDDICLFISVISLGLFLIVGYIKMMINKPAVLKELRLFIFILIYGVSDRGNLRDGIKIIHIG